LQVLAKSNKAFHFGTFQIAQLKFEAHENQLSKSKWQRYRLQIATTQSI